MARKRISMKKIREIIRFSEFPGMSVRKIAGGYSDAFRHPNMMERATRI